MLSTLGAQLAWRSAAAASMGRDPSRLGDILRAALARLPAGAELSHYPIWADWPVVVGPTIARHAQPLRLRRGVLVVSVDGPDWMQELRFRKAELRERLNERLGRPVVRDLFFVLASDP